MMSFRLTEKQRSRLRGMVRRPRSRKQLHRAEALLALDEGRPLETVARQCRVGIERVESWVERFSTLKMAFLEEPSGDESGPRSNDARDDDPADEEPEWRT
ncbi:hypothetical protein TA3x_003010 [Tundrisphaera sp. TA3]|uniref:hypothetical protein n=1 Tax=Tundrisphaera sp. TA3 TaxID=3435775 RepID=UPI003EB7CB94